MGMTITEDEQLELRNVLTYRGTVSQRDLSTIMEEMEQVIQKNNAEKVGPMISVTHGVAKENNQIVVDAELMQALDRPLDVSGMYTLKPRFLLQNAVKVHFEGAVNEMGKCSLAMKNYIKENALTPITSGYTVNVKMPKSEAEVKNGCIVDYYMGVTSNIL